LKDTGHFEVSKLNPLTENPNSAVLCNTHDYYEVSLLVGESTVQFAGQVLQLKKQALVFSSPNTPQKWEHKNSVRHGYSCIFNKALFYQHGDIAKYSVFRPEGNHVFELTDQQVNLLNKVYEQMLEDNESEYPGKNESIRLCVSELIHFALRMAPTTIGAGQPISAPQRIFAVFMELIEVQFPTDYSYNSIRLRSPKEFAERLNVHVRHLNKVVKKVADKTTSQLINERTMQEAKMLLSQTNWTVAKIAFVLGFAEANHFSVSFKKHVQLTPLKFREAGAEFSPMTNLVNQF